MNRKSRSVCILISSVILLFSCTPSGKNETQHADKSTTLDSTQTILDSLTHQLEKIGDRSIIPGFAVCIVDDSKAVYQKGFGYASVKDRIAFTEQSVNFIASVSKTFVGASIMKLIEQGKLDLDEEINDILPFEVVNPHFPDLPYTVRHLVTHTAGLVDDFDPEEVGEADVLLLEDAHSETDSIQAILDNELEYYRLGVDLSMEEILKRYLTPGGKWYSENNFERFEPGTRYCYSNLGAELAGLIVEIRSKIPFSQFTERYVFEPLEMTNTGWFYEDVDSMLVSEIYFPDDWESPTLAIEHPKYRYPSYPSGELKSNVADISKYIIEMINGSNGQGQILTRDSYKTLFEPVLNNGHFPEGRDTTATSDEYDVGVFWAVSSSGLRLHNGGSIGVYSFLYFDPETKSGAFGFCNLPLPDFGEIRDLVYQAERRLALAQMN